jgi:hypothetical protein
MAPTNRVCQILRFIEPPFKNSETWNSVHLRTKNLGLIAMQSTPDLSTKNKRRTPTPQRWRISVALEQNKLVGMWILLLQNRRVHSYPSELKTAVKPTEPLSES